jgi:hypothetical protein
MAAMIVRRVKLGSSYALPQALEIKRAGIGEKVTAISRGGAGAFVGEISNNGDGT